MVNYSPFQPLLPTTLFQKNAFKVQNVVSFRKATAFWALMKSAAQLEDGPSCRWAEPDVTKAKIVNR